MKKLEDIPKKHVFEVPEGYFEKLPGVIQARVSQERTEAGWNAYLRFSLKYALPAFAIAIAAWFFWSKPTLTTEDMLASVDSPSLVAFLQDSDITTDDLLDEVQLNNDEIDAIHQNTMDDIQLDDSDFENLTEEFDADYF